MSAARAPAAACAARQRAHGAASRSRHPSTTTPGATARSGTWHETRPGRPVSSPQAEDHPTSERTKTGPAADVERSAETGRLPFGICPGGTGFRHAQVLDPMDPRNWIADKGYVGNGMITPFKKPAGGELLDWQKEFNKQVNKIRYVNEQVIANFKTWRSMHTERLM